MSATHDVPTVTEAEALEIAEFDDGGDDPRDAIEVGDLTPSQRRAVTRIVNGGLESASTGGRARVEVDTLEISRLSGRTITVRIRMRRLDLPDNALGNVFPERGLFFVGSHGGIEVAGVDHSSRFEGKRTRARKYPLIYGFTRL